MRMPRRAATVAIFPALVVLPFFPVPRMEVQQATPTMSFQCGTMMSASPMAGMAGMAMGTPAAGHAMAEANREFDQLYIDMMMQHHQSIIAMALAAQDQLTDERLVAIAENIISSQRAEMEELRGHREQWYGSSNSMPMDDPMMGMMMEMMPGIGDMASMKQQMDAQALVSAFCAREDPDLTFIEIVIPHHEMAIQASETARNQAMHEEIRAIAEQVIHDQQAEIDELEAIQTELTGEGTPVAS